MNIDKILSDEYYTFLENNHNVAFYSLSIGLEEYFETYHQVCVYLSEYERDDKEKINYKAEKNGIGYIKSYFKILYLIFDYPHKHYTFKHFEV